MLFERSTHDVICIESTKLYSFPFHTFRAKKTYIYYREQAFELFEAFEVYTVERRR